jgi:hypothetical protein
VNGALLQLEGLTSPVHEVACSGSCLRYDMYLCKALILYTCFNVSCETGSNIHSPVMSNFNYVQLQNACRLCLSSDTNNIDILGEEGRRQEYRDKIWKHFSLWVRMSSYWL